MWRVYFTVCYPPLQRGRRTDETILLKIPRLAPPCDKRHQGDRRQNIGGVHYAAKQFADSTHSRVVDVRFGCRNTNILTTR